MERELREKLDAMTTGIPAEVRAWLLGIEPNPPDDLARMMEQASTKMAVVMMSLLLKRLANMDRSLEYMEEIERGLLDPKNIKGMDASQRIQAYSALQKNHSDFMEYARKFISQNKDMFQQPTASDELSNVLRQLDPAVVRAILGLVRRKGAATTVNDIAASVEASPAPPAEPKVQTVVQRNGNPAKKDHPRVSSLFKEISGA